VKTTEWLLRMLLYLVFLDQLNSQYVSLST
jgi:hypothetical protein